LKKFIPVNHPLLGELERKYLLECFDSGWITSEGPFIKRFEDAFSLRMDRAYGIAVANGTAALEIAVAALGLGPGDEVIMPTFTIISCPLAVVRAGATPVLVDSDITNWNMDISQIENRITSRTRAIMVVHIYGLSVDMQAIISLAKKYNLYVIEDAAEMHGQTFNGQPCGSFGHISTFSFYINKHLTTGEGGMIVVNDADLAERCRSFRNLCFSPGRRFVHEELGWNYRMTSMQAAIGLAQLERLDDFISRKRLMGARYNELLDDIPGLILPPKSSEQSESIYWVFGLMLEDNLPFDASVVMHHLEELGVGTRPFFWPIHEQPVFLKRGFFKNKKFPIAEKLSRRGFYLPSGLGLTNEQQDSVAKLMRKVMNQLVNSQKKPKL